MVVFVVVRYVKRPGVGFVGTQLAIDLELGRNIGEHQPCRWRWWLRYRRTDQRTQVGRAKGALGLSELHGRQQFGCAAAFVQGIHRQHFGAETCALTPTELAHVLLSYGTQAQECLAVQHHLATRLAPEQRREVGWVDDAAMCSVWCTRMFSQPLRVTPDDDALAVYAHGDRRADVLDGYRIAIAERGH